jgi:glycolate oxidase iron-sulfur subunit
MMNPPTYNGLKQIILEGAGQCVACGLCLPWCPTYQLEQTESESPRGRLSLLQAIARAELTDTNAAMKLVGHCLLCRSCERHCPSSVPFGEVMDAGRSLAQQARPLPGRLSRNLAGFALRRPEWLRRMGRLAVMLRRLVPPGIVARTAGSSAMRGLAYLPFVQSHPGWHGGDTSRTVNRGRVDLFLGCVARMLDARTIDDSIRLLNLLGFTVHIASQQACCGALSLHDGRRQEARGLMQRNLAAFGEGEVEAIVHMASGCGVTLSEYTHHIPGSQDFTDKLDEICAFVDRCWKDDLRPSPSAAKIMLHNPCTLLNCLPEPGAPARLLTRIPGIVLIVLDGGYGCCGAAGTNMLTRPETAAALRSPLIEQIEQNRPDVIATTNPGCALHLKEGLLAAGLAIPVLHPASILLDQLAQPNSAIIGGQLE